MQIENQFRSSIPSASHAASEMLAMLVSAGHFNTRARRAVLEALCEADGQASAIALLEQGRRHHPALGLVTVYRTLEILTELGLVRKIHQANGCHTYAPAVYDHGHHVICEQCGKANEFAGCDTSTIVATVEQQTGYEVHEHMLVMSGLCPTCRSGGS